MKNKNYQVKEAIGDKGNGRLSNFLKANLTYEGGQSFLQSPLRRGVIKALVLFSGGLDSMLAVKILQNQGIEVDGICFKSNFFGCEKACKAAQYLGIKLIEADISGDILVLVKNPPSGYGKHINPCIDCHALMIKKTSNYLQQNFTAPIAAEGYKDSEITPPYTPCEGGLYDFIATGEVLGQRPFSQNKNALRRIEKIADMEILRPLSAKLLPETEIEKKGLVIRGKLRDIQGRTRKQQMELAEKYHIKKYESPAGGCLLTDPEFSQRLLVMLENWPDCVPDDIELLKYGRIFWFSLTRQFTPRHANLRQAGIKILVVIGRNQQDNENLKKLAKKGDVILELNKIAGPFTIARNFKFQISNNKQILHPKSQISNSLEIKIPENLKMSELKLREEKSPAEILRLAGLLTGYYAVKTRGKNARIIFRFI